MARFLILVHRYLGIAVGIVLLLWTLSGIVMMYKEYPELDEQEKVTLLAPLSLQSCCLLSSSGILRAGEYSSATVEMMGDVPVLRLQTTDGGRIAYNLREGRSFAAIDTNIASSLATDLSARYLGNAVVSFAGEIHNDQWTVYGGLNPLRPLYKYQVDDPVNSEFYISSRTGEIIQLTTSEQRLWGYLGAVIHWLYPTLLRQHTAVWSQVVIWLTILGIFLTATGLYIGIKQYKRRQTGHLSPYSGIALYHHYAGLIFGILTLSWVFSGLFSMNPWGSLEGEGTALETERLQGRYLAWDEIEQLITALAAQEDLTQIRRVEIFVQAGEPVVISYAENARQTRLDRLTLQPDPLTEDQLFQLAARLQPRQEIDTAGLVSGPDAYYYSHHIVREFPVYRIIMDNPEQHRYYLNSTTGQLVQKVDQELRWYRWLFYGLHRGDFTAWSRSRPVWDLFMLIFLGGVTLVCGTGCYMAVRRTIF